ncbi:MAG: hypothetical protein L3J82_09255 [Planctomycetes bacterium]|nr:hypothetical protein [Planctomycetota bacterium]
MLKTALTIVLLILAPAYLAGADTLSVLPLAKALQNSGFLSSDSKKVQLATENVTKLLLNQPDEDELPALSARLKQFAKHSDSNIGKLFFAALSNTPDIENLSENATAASIRVDWPLELGAKILVRVSYLKTESGWRIEGASAQMLGTAASAVAAAGPYFSSEEPDLALLDKPELAYLLGKKPLGDDEFDFDETLKKYFLVATGDFEATLERLSAGVSLDVSREKRLKTMLDHLITKAERDELKKIDADKDKQKALWDKLISQIAGAPKWPRPTSFPTRTGALVQIMLSDHGGEIDSELTGQRLSSGRIGIRGGTTKPRILEKKNDEEAETDSD